MGFFSKNENKVKSELEIFRDNLSNYSNNNSVVLVPQVSKYLDAIIKGSEENPFYYDSNLISVINNYFLTCSENEKDFGEYLREVKNVFDMVYIKGKDSIFKDFNLFMKLFNVNGIYSRGLFDINFYRLFSNSEHYYMLMDEIMSNNFILENYDTIIKFFIDIRKYFDNGEKFYFDITSMVKSLTLGVNIEDFIRKYKDRLDKREGIYGVDEVLLEKIHEKTVGAEGFLDSLDKSISEAKKALSVLRSKLDSYPRDLKDINREYLDKYNRDIEDKLDEIRNVINSGKDEINQYSLGIENKLRNSINETTSSSLEELREEKVRIIDSLKKYEEIIANLALSKSGEITKLGGEQLEALEDFIKNQPHLKEIFENMLPGKKMLEIAQMASELSSSKKEVIVSPVSRSDNQVQTSSVVVPGLTVSTPNVIVPNDPVDMRVNEVLDKSIPFDKRLKIVEDRMKKNTKKGIIYHEKAKQIIKYIMQGYSPYLYGPSGSGKTLLAFQICELLGIDCLNIGYINEEYQVKGSDPFLGQWSKSTMYTCYKYGHAALVDEMDNGRAQANLVLGPFISSTDKLYTFPNGENVSRHPNFRLIATGNTDGSGATESHSTREKIDEAVMQRFKPLVLIDYDENVEAKIMSSYKHWYNFIKQFRKAGIERQDSRRNEFTIRGAVTTRDVAEIVDTLENGVADTKEIMNADFIRANDVEYLKSLVETLNNYYSRQGSREEKELFNAFREEVDVYKRTRRI